MFTNIPKQTEGIITEKLSAAFVSGLVVGSGARGSRFGYVVATILIFTIGVLVGWLFGH